MCLHSRGHRQPHTPWHSFSTEARSASAWLHLGTLGPWRLPLEGDSARPSAPGLAIPNADTLARLRRPRDDRSDRHRLSRFEHEDGAAAEEKAETKAGARRAGRESDVGSGDRPGARACTLVHFGDVDSIASLHLPVADPHGTPRVSEAARGRELWRLPRPRSRTYRRTTMASASSPRAGLAGARRLFLRVSPPSAARHGGAAALTVRRHSRPVARHHARADARGGGLCPRRVSDRPAARPARYGRGRAGLSSASPP